MTSPPADLTGPDQGEADLSIRGENLVARVGGTIIVPANAPHAFRNASGEAARLLCLCTPPGQDEFFAAVGVPVASRTEPPLALDEDAEVALMAKSKALAPEYRTELLLP